MSRSQHDDLAPWIVAGESTHQRWLTQDARLDDDARPRFVRWSIALVFVLVGVFVSWASFARLDETAVTQGEIITTSSLQMVAHLEGGIVTEWLVSEGDVVLAGQPLAKLEGATLAAELARYDARRIALELRTERLRARLESREPLFTDVTGANRSMIQTERAILESERRLFDHERRVLEEQLRQRKLERDNFKTQAKTTHRQLDLVSEQLRMWRKLSDKGYGARLEVLGAEREQAAARGDLRNLEGQIKSAEIGIAEFEERLQELEQRTGNAIVTALGDTRGELTELSETMSGLVHRVGRLVIRAPIEGVVQALPNRTREAVIPPGGVVAEILPIENELLVETRVSTNDIGFVREGQSGQVKIQTFNFARYGSIDGEVESISPTTFTDEPGGTPYYKARLRLAQAYVGGDPARNRLLPGMTVQADISTGSKTMMEYILKPVFTTLNEAFRER
ncbi:MAG: HlyD family type I secretion periplasmic adaptor subunit [Pseudomonadota bacterium]